MTATPTNADDLDRGPRADRARAASVASNTDGYENGRGGTHDR
jgi:hypothetical protein